MRYFIVSAAIHILVLFVSIHYEKDEVFGEMKAAEMSGETADSKNKIQGFEVEVIEQVPGDGVKKEVKAHYWGIGVQGEYTPMGYRIDIVYGGYNGEAAGLVPGDVILTVNGKPPMENDISGDGPKKLILGIQRGNVMLTILTERCKVFY